MDRVSSLLVIKFLLFRPLYMVRSYIFHRKTGYGKLTQTIHSSTLSGSGMAAQAGIRWFPVFLYQRNGMDCRLGRSANRAFLTVFSPG